MIDKIEKELIIKNAMEFLKRDNLMADINEKIILLDFCLNTYWGIYKIKLDDEKDCLLVYKEPRRYPIEISSDNKELYNLFNEKYNEITEKWAEMKEENKINTILENCYKFLKKDNLDYMYLKEEEEEYLFLPFGIKSEELPDYDIVGMVHYLETNKYYCRYVAPEQRDKWIKHNEYELKNKDIVELFLIKIKEQKQQEQAEQLTENYSDNDEHRDEEMLKACQQGLDLVDEMVEQSNTKQDAGINIPNNGKYRRKSDGKIFFLISQHELKTTMNGITPSKEICEIVVDITKIYVLFSPALEGRYNHDILYVKENELNEDYEMLSED